MAATKVKLIVQLTVLYYELENGTCSDAKSVASLNCQRKLKICEVKAEVVVVFNQPEMLFSSPWCLSWILRLVSEAAQSA